MTDTCLAGLRVLDFSLRLPGPYCTRILADLGAEVVKVEDTGEGDPLRSMPPLLGGVGSAFVLLIRGKRSIAVDLKQPAGQAVAQDLAAVNDVVVEGFRPGVARRLGIDFSTLAARNPRLVYCSISGYGQEGEYRDLPGHDLTYAGIAGLLDALTPGTPRVPGVQVVDAASAFLAAIRILAALRATGAGPQHLDVSLVTAAQALMPVAIADVAGGPSPGRSLMELLRGSERNDLYCCSDGRWLALSPLEEPFWQRLCAALRDEGAIEPDETPTSERLHDVFRGRTSAEWFSMLAAAGVPVAPVRSVRDAMQRPPGAPFLADPSGADALEARVDGVPEHGQHTAECLAALGYAEEQIGALAAEGVIRIAGGR